MKFSAMSEALAQLLGHKIYNGFTMFSNSRDLRLITEMLDEKWQKTGNGFTRTEFDQLTGHCAVRDTLSAH